MQRAWPLFVSAGRFVVRVDQSAGYAWVCVFKLPTNNIWAKDLVSDGQNESCNLFARVLTKIINSYRQSLFCCKLQLINCNADLQSKSTKNIKSEF